MMEPTKYTVGRHTLDNKVASAPTPMFLDQGPISAHRCSPKGSYDTPCSSQFDTLIFISRLIDLLMVPPHQHASLTLFLPLQPSGRELPTGLPRGDVYTSFRLRSSYISLHNNRCEIFVIHSVFVVMLNCMPRRGRGPMPDARLRLLRL